MFGFDGYLFGCNCLLGVVKVVAMLVWGVLFIVWFGCCIVYDICVVLVSSAVVMCYDSLGVVLFICGLACCLWSVFDCLVTWYCVCLFGVSVLLVLLLCLFLVSEGCCFGFGLGGLRGMSYCCQLHLLALVFALCVCWLVLAFGWVGF